MTALPRLATMDAAFGILHVKHPAIQWDQYEIAVDDVRVLLYRPQGWCRRALIDKIPLS